MKELYFDKLEVSIFLKDDASPRAAGSPSTRAS